MNEGGETKMNTNINAMLEQFGIFVNTDCVIRKAFCKYLHPKEAYIGNGILNKELVRVAKGEAKAVQAAGAGAATTQATAMFSQSMWPGAHTGLQAMPLERQERRPRPANNRRARKPLWSPI